MKKTNNILAEKPGDRPTCKVEGKIYRDGESFELKSNPEKNCICGPGYKGEIKLNIGFSFLKLISPAF